jgi:hypothetical protein
VWGAPDSRSGDQLLGDSLETRRSALEPASAEAIDAAGATGAAPAPDPSPGVHNATTRATIAWPFSQIRLQEASPELAELAGLSGDLLDALSDVVGEERLTPLRNRADSLRARLR